MISAFSQSKCKLLTILQIFLPKVLIRNALHIVDNRWALVEILMLSFSYYMYIFLFYFQAHWPLSGRLLGIKAQCAIPCISGTMSQCHIIILSSSLHKKAGCSRLLLPTKTCALSPLSLFFLVPLPAPINNISQTRLQFLARGSINHRKHLGTQTTQQQEEQVSNITA